MWERTKHSPEQDMIHRDDRPGIHPGTRTPDDVTGAIDNTGTRSFRIPRILIAGTHSGCGKTTISRGLMQALVSQGLVVQPFKVGPDFIDPTHHTAICGRPSRNLDPFMMGEEGVRQTFFSACQGADIAVIEGVMGMFDGLDGTSVSSSSHVAEILGAPVLLVLDVRGMSRSANAIVRGFSQFEGTERINGVIFNRVGSERHQQLIGCSLEMPALGWVNRRASLEMESRHLGLHMASETKAGTSAGEAIAEDCDIGAILEIAREAPGIIIRDIVPSLPAEHPVIGIARDEAFCFYYQDNLDRLVKKGAALVFFSPVHDSFPEIDALYLGGGYPELHAEALEASPCRDAVRKAADAGMPVYGECGGLLYLSRSIDTGRGFRMAGVLPADGEMTSSVQALGYSVGSCTGSNSFISPGMCITGHEFHYSRMACMADARFIIRLDRGKGIRAGFDGLTEHETTGSYTHSYFSDEFAGSLVKAASRFRNR